MEDYYEVLCVSKNAEAEEIRKSYQCLVKRLHPDKHDEKLSAVEREAAVQKFHEVSRAYGVLSDAKLRHEYDAKLKAFELSQQWPISDTVELDQMDYDEQEGSYSCSCRCGESYQVTVEDLECGVTVVCCSGCTLCIKLVCPSDTR